jgi:hypothetical protein
MSGAETDATTAETWVDVPGTGLALLGVWPNPASAHPSLAISVPVAGDGQVRVFDVAGRLVHQERLAGLSAGSQRVAIGGPGLGPGVYVARFEFAGRRLQTRFVVFP